MNIKFIYRIDDIHPAMMWSRFWEVMKIMEENQVVPLLGVIPDNQDKELMFDRINPDFFPIIKSLVDNGKVEISQHGYQHIYTTKQNSINQILYGSVSNSEFVGLPYEKQYQMVKKGKLILESHGLFTDVWMAPSHTNDRITFRVLRELGFKYITDGFALYPFNNNGLLFIPQQLWCPQKIFPFNFGIFTICLHLNDLKADSINEIKAHLNSNDEIISFSEATKLPQKPIYKGVDILYKLRCVVAHKMVRPLRNLIG